MKILITGASGFVGNHLVHHAVEQGFETFAGVRASSNISKLKNLPSLTFLDLPYHDKEKLKAFLLECKEKYGRFDYIIHNAGLTKCKKKTDFDRVNYLYTRHFVEALIETQCEPRKFIYMSSLSAIGSGDEATLQPMHADQQSNPNTLYGHSKLKAEQFLQSTHNFPYIIARPTGIYGPDDKDYTIYVATIDKGIEPYLGFKPQYLSFIYVTDLVNLIFSMLQSPITRKAYFISDGKSYTQQEYAQIVKKHLHKKTLKITVPLCITKAICYTMDYVGGLFGKVPTMNADKYKIMSCRNWLCDISEAEKDFSFKPQYFLDDGVKETVSWYLKEKTSSHK